MGSKGGTAQDVLGLSIDNCPVAMGVVEGPDFVIRFYNQAAQRLSGLSAERAVGRTVVEALPAAGRTVLPFLKRAYAGEKVCFTSELDLPGGRRYLNVVYIPLPGEPTAPRRILYYAVDHTELRAANDELARRLKEQDAAAQALRESEQSLRTLADSIPQLAWMANGDGYIFWYNRRWYEYTGAAPRDMEGWGWQSVHDPAVLPKVLERWKSSIASGQPFDMEFPLKGADGRFRWFLTRVMPLKDAEGRVVRWFGTNTDVNETVELARALKRSREELSAFVENALVGLHWVGPDGIIQWANAADYELLGYERDEYIGQHIAKFHVDQRVIEDILARLTRGERIRGAEARLRCKDGSIKTVLIDSSVFRDNGKFVHTQCFTRDVTEQRRIEHASQQLNEIGAKLILERDLEKIVQAVTDAGTRLSGAAFGAFFYNARNEAGESYTLFTLSGASRESFANFPMPRKTALFGPTFEGQGVLRIDDVTTDPRYGRNSPHNGLPAGHLPVRSYLAVPVKSGSGEVLGGLFFGHPDPGVFGKDSEGSLAALASQAALAIDNSKLYAALQRELATVRQTEQKNRYLAEIIESAEAAIMGADLEGRINAWSQGATKLLGYERAEILGRSLAVIAPEDRRNEPLDIFARIVRGESLEPYETVRRHKDGTLVPVSIKVSAVRDADGRILGASGILRDITNEKRAQKALYEAREALAKSHEALEARVAERTASLLDAIAQMEEFSYTVSHDLRAPLRAMQAYSKALLQDFPDLLEGAPEAARYLKKIGSNAERLDRMILDVLTFSRMARAEMRLQRIALDRMVRDLIEHYPSMQAPRAEVHIEPLAQVYGHEPSLTQVLSNLLTNAVKFVPPDTTPRVRVWSERRGERIRIWVGDNGIGIDPQYHDRLFKMFERIHPDLPYEGTGVGLAIVRRAVERMGGRVGVESAEGAGSRFWFELKASDES